MTCTTSTPLKITCPRCLGRRQEEREAALGPRDGLPEKLFPNQDPVMSGYVQLETREDGTVLAEIYFACPVCELSGTLTG